MLAAGHAPDLDAQLIAALGDRATGVRRYAAAALIARGEAAHAVLRAHLDNSPRGLWCTAVLARTPAGRWVLRRRADHSVGLVAAAVEQPGLTCYQLVGLAKALVVCRGARPGEALSALLGHRLVTVRDAAGAALTARCDSRALPWLTTHPRACTVAVVQWLGEAGDPAAFPLLRRLGSWRSLFVAPAEVRAAARRAERALREATGHIADGALSRAAPPDGEPTAAALSLWSAEDPPDDPETR